MEKRKKILIITNLFPTEWDKQRGMFNCQQFEQLSAFHDLVVLIPVPFFTYNRNVLHPTYKFSDKIEVRYVKFYYVPKLFRFLHGISLYLSMKDELSKAKSKCYDLVIGSWAFPDGYAAIKFAKSLRIPCIIKVHGSDINEFTKEYVRRYFIKHVLNAAKNIVSVSCDLKNRMLELGVDQNKIHVIYNGLNDDIFKYKDRMSSRDIIKLDRVTFTFLYVGNLKVSKGVVELLNAFKKFIKIHDAKLYIIGDGDQRHWLEKDIIECDLSESVYLIGRRTLHEISLYMSAVNVLLLPSYNEGVPNVLLEAKGCGLPVVATAVGGIPEITNDTDAVLVEKQNTESLLNGMLEAYDKDWDHSLIIKQSQQYSWEKNCEMLNQVITNVG